MILRYSSLNINLINKNYINMKVMSKIIKQEQE